MTKRWHYLCLPFLLFLLTKTCFAGWLYCPYGLEQVSVTLTGGMAGTIPQGKATYTYTNDAYVGLYKGLEEVSLEAAHDPAKIYTGNYVKVTLKGTGEEFQAIATELYYKYLVQKNLSAQRDKEAQTISVTFSAYSLLSLSGQGGERDTRYGVGVQNLWLSRYLSDLSRNFNLHKILIDRLARELCLPDEDLAKALDAKESARTARLHQEISGKEEGLGISDVLSPFYPSEVDYYHFDRYST